MLMCYNDLFSKLVSPVRKELLLSNFCYVFRRCSSMCRKICRTFALFQLEYHHAEQKTFFCVPNQKPMITLTNAHGNYLRPIEKIFLSSCSEKPRLQLYKISSNYLSRLRRSNKWMMRQNLCHTLYSVFWKMSTKLQKTHWNERS